MVRTIFLSREQFKILYRIYPKYSDTSSKPYFCSKNWTSTMYYPMLCLNISGWVANSVNPDEKPRSVASHLGLHCLPWTVWIYTVNTVYINVFVYAGLNRDSHFLICSVFFVSKGNLFDVSYYIYSKFSDRQAWANIVDTDQKPHNAVS